MPVLNLEEANPPRRSRIPAVSTAVETSVPSSSSSAFTLTAEQAWVATVREELDGYFITLKQFSRMQPDEVMLALSAITARLSELRMHLCRNDSRRFTGLRTREVDPLIDECDRQFKVHSRVQAIRQFDWEISGKGQV